MRWLLDTNVISEIRHPQGDREVKRRISALPSESLFISAIVLGELVKGVQRLPEGERKGELLRWLVSLETDYGDRIVPFDRESARVWGELAAGIEARGLSIGMADGQIAATAIQNRMVLVSRNTRHFDLPELRLWNPWERDAMTVRQRSP
jgi:predicted nucleic acid-binding protein